MAAFPYFKHGIVLVEAIIPKTALDITISNNITYPLKWSKEQQQITRGQY